MKTKRRVPDKVVHKTVVSEETKGLEFILSDATPDRYDDIIMTDGWELANFKKNPIALFAHSGSFPIGKWKNVRIEENALRGTLDLAPEGTSDRIDEIRKLVDSDILRAVSVGFTPIKYEERKGDTYGLVYTEQELVECSLVSVPANPSALIQAKSLGISADTQDLVFCEKMKIDKKYNRRGYNQIVRYEIQEEINKIVNLETKKYPTDYGLLINSLKNNKRLQNLKRELENF
jgi:HK97 family phage prohead protease